MANNLVQLVITAKDQASSVFGKIGASMSVLGAKANAAAGSTGSLTNAIAGGILQANLLGQAINAVGNAASFMMGKFGEAAKVETQLIASASNFMALTNTSFKDGQKFVADFNIEIAKVAAALPGATADYNRVANSIMDNLIPAYKRLDGSLDQAGLKKGLTDLTKQMTLMGIQSDTPAQAVGMFTARFLSGATYGSLSQLQFAENNPAFLSKLEGEFKKRGKDIKELQKLTDKERLDILMAVSGKFINQEVVDASRNSVEGLIASIQSAFFDPTTGLLGLMRDLSQAEGNQSAISAVANSINKLNIFFSSGAKLLSAMGVPSIDPMLVLYNGINTFSGWINQASRYIEKITAVTKQNGGGLRGLTTLAEKYLNPDTLVKSLSNITVKGIEVLTPFISRYLDPSAILVNSQKILDVSLGWLNGLFSQLATMTTKLLGGGTGILQFSAVGAKLGWFLGDLLGQAVNFIIDLPWIDILATLGSAALIIIPPAIAAVSAFIARAAIVLVDGLWRIGVNVASALGDLWNVTADATKKGMKPALEKALAGVDSFTSGFGKLISDTINGIGNAFAGIYNSITGFITNFVTAGISSANSFFNGIVNGITQMWQQIMQSIRDAIGGVVNSVKSTISQITSPLAGISGATGNAVSGIGNGAMNAAGNAVSGIGNGAMNAAGNAVSGIGSFFGINPQQKYGGTPVSGLLGAFATESRNMPTGARPVIANSSENIFTPEQTQKLMQGSVSQGQKLSAPAFAPVFNFTLNGVSDPQAIAQMALQELDRAFARYQQEQLA